MKHGMMILTLCAMMLGTAQAMTFMDVTSEQFTGDRCSVVAWGDVNSDGFADLFMGVAGTGSSRLYLNDGAQWIDASDEYGVNSISNVRSARFIDFNQDGKLDLFCLTDNEEGAELYRQSESNRMQRVVLNLDGGASDIRAATWCDADNDGNLDLYLSNRSSSSDECVLLVSTADEFVEARGAAGPFSETQVSQISPVDFDQDGDMDYFISKSENAPSLWSPVRPGYRNYGPVMGFPDKIAQTGVTWADFNRDGNLDFFASGSVENNCLFYQYDGENGAPCSFENMTDAFSLRDVTRGATGAHAIDVNCDGRTDLFLTRSEGNILLINRGIRWEYFERSALTLEGWDTQSCAWGDYDNDGDLDVAMAVGPNGVKLFRNDTANGHEFIGLRLCGPGESMTPVLNCLVSVEFAYGKQWAATSMYAGTVGHDLNTKLIYNPSWYHSEEWSVNVLWPNGVVTTLTQSEVAVNGYTALHMPTSTTPGNHDLAMPLPVAPEVVNYPNPFNPTTKIEFTLSEAADITLSIYNLLGQEVALLAGGRYEAGLHSLSFNASALPSGLYLARLDTPTGSIVHRMLLTK